MKRISIALPDETYELILNETLSRLRPDLPSGKAISKKAVQVATEAIMEAFPSDVFPCGKCGKFFSIEGDEGSLREEGTFCNKHLPKGSE